jgi:hypothetical protein
MKRFLTLIGLLSAATFAQATPMTFSVTCSGGADVFHDLATAIDAANDGDVVNITAGTCQLLTRLNMTTKNITIQGQGAGATIIKTPVGFGTWVYNTATGVPAFTLKSLTLKHATYNGQSIVVWANMGASWRGGFKIDNVEFNYPAINGNTIFLGGPIYGVISNSSFVQYGEAAIIVDAALDSTLENGSIASGSLFGAFAASTPFTPGAANMLYIEGNSFNGIAAGNPGGFAAFDTARRGGRVVFRYNTLNRATFYSHWTSESNWNALWVEIYHNSFNWDAGGGSGYQPIRLQGGGTGLIYKNQFTGYGINGITIGEDRSTRGGAPLGQCNSDPMYGNQVWDGAGTDASAPHWPCLSQTGCDAGVTQAQILAGVKQASYPLYLWRNGQQQKCIDATLPGGSCDNSFGVDFATDPAYFKSTAHSTSGFGNGDVDWCKNAAQLSGCGTHTLTYTAYTYPHP